MKNSFPESSPIFLVEDDLVYAELVSYAIKQQFKCTIKTFHNGNDLLENLSSNPALIILDYVLPDMHGDEMFTKIKSFNPAIPVIFLTANNDVNKVVELIKLGAYDYITKDEHAQSLLIEDIKKIQEHLHLKQNIAYLEDLLQNEYNTSDSFLGNAPEIKQALNLVEKLAKTEISIAIHGEYGTGKEHLAKLFHFNSNRAKKPLVVFNAETCAQDQIQTQLFGMVSDKKKGSANSGSIAAARGGTLLLQEPQLLPKAIQAELLQLEAATKGDATNSIRFLLLSKSNLAEEVANQNLIKEFYYRFASVNIQLPPLRKRKADILILAKLFIDELANNQQVDYPAFSEEAKTKLLEYTYPGNIDELKSCMELAWAISDKHTIKGNDITFYPVDIKTDLLMEERTLEEYTALIIKYFLKNYNNNVNLVAEKLDMSRSTIYKMIKEGRL